MALPKETVLVIAGSHKDFTAWLASRQTDNRLYEFVDRREQVYGRTRASYLLGPRATDSPLYGDLDYFRMMGFLQEPPCV